MNAKEYTISLGFDCRIFNKNKLMIAAMEALPTDCKISKIEYSNLSGGSIRFESSLLDFPNGATLNLNITESVKLEYNIKH